MSQRLITSATRGMIRARARIRSVVVRKRRIVQQLLQAELLAETLPVAFGDDADENPAVRGVENIVDRPGMLALRHRARLVAGHLVFDHVLRHQKQAVLEQPDADVGAVRAAAALLVECGEDRDRAEHAAHDVVGGGADALRLLLGPGHHREPRHHLHHLVERRAMLIGTGQESLVPGDDQMRMPCLQLIGAEALPVQQPVAKILQKHVGGGEQPVHGLLVRRLG